MLKEFSDESLLGCPTLIALRKERRRKKETLFLAVIWSPFWVVISLTSFSRTSSSEDTLLLLIIIVVVVYCSTTLVFFKLSYTRNTRVHLDNMMMNTKGILMSEKDCKPQRKEKTAKKVEMLRTTKMMKTKKMH